MARTVCELLDWKRPNGGLKNHECRQLLERLAAEGALMLPDLRKLGGRGPRRAGVSGPSCYPAPIECVASQCEPLELILVEGKAESRRWREQMERHHYLGCRVPFGANLRYWVRNGNRELACLLWTSPAWRMQARDTWIGWSDEQRSQGTAAHPAGRSSPEPEARRRSRPFDTTLAGRSDHDTGCPSPSVQADGAAHRRRHHLAAAPTGHSLSR